MPKGGSGTKNALCDGNCAPRGEPDISPQPSLRSYDCAMANSSKTLLSFIRLQPALKNASKVLLVYEP
jgi:hypothetical protein